MSKRFFAFLSVLVVFMTVAALTGLASGAGPVRATIRGRVLDPDGRPAVGINLLLYPHTGETLDRLNLHFKIPNYDFHRVTTDHNGEFVMADVIDYPENTAHRYALFVDGPTKFYHGITQVVLGQATQFDVTIRLQRATVIRIKLKDKNGQPFNGTRAVYVQSGVLGQGVMKGISYVTEINFVNGVGEWGPVVIKDLDRFQGRVAILDFPNEKFAREAMTQRGMRWTDTAGPLRWTTRSLRGQALDQAPRFNPGGYTELDFALQ